MTYTLLGVTLNPTPSLTYILILANFYKEQLNVVSIRLWYSFVRQGEI